MQARRGRRGQRDLLSLPLLPFTCRAPSPSFRGALFQPLLCPRAFRLIHLDHDSHGISDPANLWDRRLRSVEPLSGLALPPPSPLLTLSYSIGLYWIHMMHIWSPPRF
ncbi:hypothetical protein B0H13DRAFT_2354514 [Mycena leptocephala]|nr:hypothetical protein B0H13DRAFT_2354514 [Mycena leptocephala]